MPRSASTPALGVDEITVRTARRQPGEIEFDGERKRPPGGSPVSS